MDNGIQSLNAIPRIDKPLFYMFEGEVIRIGEYIKQVQITQVFTAHGKLYGLFTHSGGPVVHVATLRHLNQRELKDILSTRVKQTPNEYGLSCIGEWFSLQNMNIPICELLRKIAGTLSESERYFCIVVEESRSSCITADISNRLQPFLVMKDTICRMDKKILNRESPFRLDVGFGDRIARVRTEIVDTTPMEPGRTGTELTNLTTSDNLPVDLPLPESGRSSTNSLPGLQSESGNESEVTTVNGDEGWVLMAPPVATPMSEANELSIEAKLLTVEENTNGIEAGEDQSPDWGSEKNLQKDSAVKFGLAVAQQSEENSELKTECTENKRLVKIEESLQNEEFSAASSPEVMAMETATGGGINNLTEKQKGTSCIRRTNSTTKDVIEDDEDVRRVAQTSGETESDKIENTEPGEFTNVTTEDDLSTNEESKTVENLDELDVVDGGQHGRSFKCKENSARDAEIETDKNEIEHEAPEKSIEGVSELLTDEQSSTTEEPLVDAIQKKDKTDISDRAPESTMALAGTNSMRESKIDDVDACVAEQSDESDGKSEVKTEESLQASEENPASFVSPGIQRKSVNSEGETDREEEERASHFCAIVSKENSPRSDEDKNHISQKSEVNEIDESDESGNVESDDSENMPYEGDLSTDSTESSSRSSSTAESQGELDVVDNKSGQTNFECKEIGNGDDVCHKSQVTEKDENDADGFDKMTDGENSSISGSESCSRKISTSSTSESPTESVDDGNE